MIWLPFCFREFIPFRHGMRHSLFNKVDFCIRLDDQFEWCRTGTVIAVSFSMNYNAWDVDKSHFARSLVIRDLKENSKWLIDLTESAEREKEENCSLLWKWLSKHAEVKWFAHELLVICQLAGGESSDTLLIIHLSHFPIENALPYSSLSVVRICCFSVCQLIINGTCLGFRLLLDINKEFVHVFHSFD